MRRPCKRCLKKYSPTGKYQTLCLKCQKKAYEEIKMKNLKRKKKSL